MRYLSSISLALIVLMALACTVTPTPTPTPYEPLYTQSEVLSLVHQSMEARSVATGNPACKQILHSKLKNWKVDISLVDEKEKYYVTASDYIRNYDNTYTERKWSWTFFGRTGNVLPTSTHKFGKEIGC